MSFPPFCFGFNCPLKNTCGHFKEDINIKKEVYWDHTPYDFEKKKCEFYSSYPANALNEEIKHILNGRKPDNRK